MYPMVQRLEKSEEMLEGMNASVRIETESTGSSVTVPAAALTEQDGKTYVYTVYDEKNDELSGLTEVQTGISDGITVEITEGLEKGQICYYRYAETVTYVFNS